MNTPKINENDGSIKPMYPCEARKEIYLIHLLCMQILK